MSPVLTTFKERMAKDSDGSIWDDIEQYAKSNNVVNFGQGYPDFMPPNHITTALQNIAKNEKIPLIHQYTRPWGHPRLVNILSKMYGEELNRELDPKKNFLVTAGGSHALYCCIRALLKPGDEVIMFQPFYDSYDDISKHIGCKPVYVNLKLPNNDQTKNKDIDADDNVESNGTTKNKSSDKMNNIKDRSAGEFTFDEKELASKFTEKTSCLIVNTPHNPLGKVFNLRELTVISELCIKHNVIVISDEVYERLILPPNKHISIASLPGMWERTVKIASAGKALGITGWKVGWCVGPEEILKEVAKIHSLSIHICVSILQEAIAIALEHEYEMKDDESSYFNRLPHVVMDKVEQVKKMLVKVGIQPFIPEGGFYLAADISNQIATIPVSIFYNINEAEFNCNFIRICIYKNDETMERAKDIFEKWRLEKL